MDQADVGATAVRRTGPELTWIDFAFPWIPAFAGMTALTHSYVWTQDALVRCATVGRYFFDELLKLFDLEGFAEETGEALLQQALALALGVGAAYSDEFGVGQLLVG